MSYKQEYFFTGRLNRIIVLKNVIVLKNKFKVYKMRLIVMLTETVMSTKRKFVPKETTLAKFT